MIHTNLKSFLSRTGSNHSFRAVQAKTDVGVPIGIPAAVRRTGRRRVYRFGIALQVSQIQSLYRSGYTVLRTFL